MSLRADELSAIKACHDEHGFAVVKNMLSPDYVEELKESVSQVLDPEGDLGLGETRVPSTLSSNTQSHFGNCLRTKII